MLHCALDQHADPGHASGQTGGGALRPAGRRAPLPVVRQPRSACGVQLLATAPGDVRRECRPSPGVVDPAGKCNPADLRPADGGAACGDPWWPGARGCL